MFTRTTRLSALAGVALLAASLGAAAPASATSVRSVFPASMIGQPLQGDVTNYPNGPTVTGPQGCDPDSTSTAPLPKARWTADYFDGTDSFDQMTAGVTISTWRDARRAFTDVVEDTGQCTFWGDVERLPWAGKNPATHALFDFGNSTAAVIRDGRHVIAVEVVDWNGNDEAGDRDQTALAVVEALKLSRKL